MHALIVISERSRRSRWKAGIRRLEHQRRQKSSVSRSARARSSAGGGASCEGPYPSEYDTAAPSGSKNSDSSDGGPSVGPPRRYRASGPAYKAVAPSIGTTRGTARPKANLADRLQRIGTLPSMPRRARNTTECCRPCRGRHEVYESRDPPVGDEVGLRIRVPSR